MLGRFFMALTVAVSLGACFGKGFETIHPSPDSTGDITGTGAGGVGSIPDPADFSPLFLVSEGLATSERYTVYGGIASSGSIESAGGSYRWFNPRVESIGKVVTIE